MIYQKIAIGILIDRINVGGVEKIAIEQVRALRKSGENATLVVLRRKGVVKNAFPDLIRGLPIVYLDDRLPNFLKTSIKFPLFHFFSTFHLTYPLFIPFVIKRGEFSYLISHGTYTSFTAITIRKFKKIPYSVFIWDPISYILSHVYTKSLVSVVMATLRALAYHLDRLIVDNADVVLVGGAAHNAFIKQLNPKVKIQTIFPSVNPLISLPKKKKNYILFVTAWKRGKNPEYVLKLSEKLPTVSMKLVGKWLDNNYKKEFLKLLKTSRNKNIEVVGEVSQKELERYYKSAFLVVQITDDRGFGLPALEAAGNGTTFIIPEGQGVCALFKDKVDGFFIKEQDTGAIVRCVKLLLQNKQKAIEMGKSGWLRVTKNYSWKVHAEKLTNIVEKYSSMRI